MNNYEKFLASKHIRITESGFEPKALNPKLFPFQRHCVTWALKIGRAALFADTGLGKTAMQVEWAEQVVEHTGGDVLILAPLAVSTQTVREGVKFGVEVHLCRSQADVKPGVNIANYEMLAHFNAGHFKGVVLDESSILKSYMGKTKRLIVDSFDSTPYKLACTATPAPNDHLELGNHAEFLGIMPSNEMISRWFINDTMAAGNYRLKGHAVADFWRWVCTWAACFTKPSDIGFSDEGYDLPPLNFRTHVVEVDTSTNKGDMLIRMPEMNATSLHREMRLTTDDRAVKVAELVNADTSGTPWIVWCNTNYEADALRKVLPDSTEVRGSESVKIKEEKLNKFTDGKIGVMVSKPSICGFGMNWQHSYNMAFVGLSYSYEALYQAVRRSYRFGQTHPVNVHLVIAETEGTVLETVLAKQSEHEEMKRQMVTAMKEQSVNITGGNGLAPVEEDMAHGDDWAIYLGDSCRTIAKIKDDSIGLTVTSPPFENLYIYSDSVADMGNSKDSAEFFEHFKYLIKELYRVTMPGRLAAIHCKDLPLYRGRDGAMGLRDFPGEIIRAFEAEGWTYHSNVTVWKCPVIEMQRTKNHGLLYKNLRADSAGSRQGMADFIKVFRKQNWEDVPDGKFPNPVTHTKEEFPLDQWQEWASPVWMDIQQTDVLNYRLGRTAEDERHICPLQLDLIERCIRLWSNPGDLVLDPFNGVGSVGHEAIKARRKYVGIELKRSYWETAVKNLLVAENEMSQKSLF